MQHQDASDPMKPDIENPAKGPRKLGKFQKA